LDYRDFDKLELLTVVKGRLVNETPIRVGAGREPPLGSPLDITPLRIIFADGTNRPFIPGSSLKGVLRSTVEALAKAKGEVVHDPWDFEAAEAEAKEGKFCVICGIFGNQKLASHVRVYDAYPLGDPVFFTKTGVAIDRDFRGVKPGAMYVEQQVAPNTQWSFRMDIYNIQVFPEPGDKRGEYLREVLRMLREGLIQVGSRRSVGFGLIRLVEAKWVSFGIANGKLVVKGEGVLHE